MNIIQENNGVITTKRGKGYITNICGNGEWEIPIYDEGRANGEVWI